MSHSVAPDVLAHYRLVAANFHSSHTFKPFIYPLHAFGPNFIIAYLLLPPVSRNNRLSKPIFNLRYPLFAFVVYLSLKSMMECRTATPTIAYGIGLLNAWTILWAATLIIFGDARGDYRRLEKLYETQDGIGKDRQEADTPTKSSRFDALESKLRERSHYTRDYPNPNTPPNSKFDQQPQTVAQPLPSNILHRLAWVTDLVTNFRGLNWTFGSFHPSYHSTRPPPSLPSPPQTRQTLLLQTATSLSIHYILLDSLKTLTLRDPYFGTYSQSTPSPFPLALLSRLLLSLAFAYTALRSIFLLGPFLSQLLGPNLLGTFADPALYPPFFGPPSLISSRGIAGFWGGTWHPIFRLAFESVGESCGKALGPSWKRESTKGKALRTFIAFFLSGYLHACASYTTLPPTKPLSRAFLFFAIQPLGILTQQAITTWTRGSRQPNESTKTPSFLHKTANWLFTVIWLLSTGKLVADDFAACGIWLFEPVPVSLWRGGVWCWGGEWARVWKSENWWERGLAF